MTLSDRISECFQTVGEKAFTFSNIPEEILTPETGYTVTSATRVTQFGLAHFWIELTGELTASTKIVARLNGVKTGAYTGTAHAYPNVSATARITGAGNLSMSASVATTGSIRIYITAPAA